eukprot:GEMP01039191.1.p2 GENE.GEMP01039191.1~~GEMP01039191.1.p2  ORF type:complete len:104 (-),score=5.50 GEMP01039191.1:258-569(-)
MTKSHADSVTPDASAFDQSKTLAYISRSHGELIAMLFFISGTKSSPLQISQIDTCSSVRFLRKHLACCHRRRIRDADFYSSFLGANHTRQPNASTKLQNARTA